MLVLAVFLPALGYDFVDYDTPQYVSEHPIVSRGLTWEGVHFVFTREHVGNWHPVTGLAHMLDAELFGVGSARGHRAINLVWHLVATWLLYGLIARTTGSVGRAAFVAALFGVHPLHVESVVWIAERKDVLSTTLGLAATWLWIDWTRCGRARYYALALGLFALGLAAKPMLVTWPFVLLLADVWPLSRWPQRGWWALVREKLPAFALAAVASVVTVLVQAGSGAMGGFEHVGLGARAANAAHAAASYLVRAAWPVELSVLYPHPALPGGTPLAPLAVGLSLAALVAISAVVWLSRRAWARVLWAGYLGTLVPVIGLVQVGEQASADRYTYVPLTFVFALVAWTLVELARPLGRGAVRATGLVGMVAVALSAFQARVQASWWRDTETLFERSLAVAPEPPTLHYNLARWLRRRGRTDEAIAHYRRALELKPRYASALVNLGVALQVEGRLAEARAAYERALELGPDALAHHNLAMMLRATDLDAALAHHAACVALLPDSADAHDALAGALMLKGSLGEAERELLRALELDPGHVAARENLSRVRAALR